MFLVHGASFVHGYDVACKNEESGRSLYRLQPGFGLKRVTGP